MNYTVFSGKFVFEKNENKQKEAGVRPLFFFKKTLHCFFLKKLYVLYKVISVTLVWLKFNAIVGKSC